MSPFVSGPIFVLPFRICRHDQVSPDSPSSIFSGEVLEDFVGDLPEECLLCPVLVLRIYLDLTSLVSPHPRSLFASPSYATRSLSKNALSFFVCQVILDAGSVQGGTSAPLAREVCAVSTSAAFLKNWSASQVLEATTWRLKPVFTSFYLRDMSYSLEGCHSLGPVVAAGFIL